MSSTQYNDIAEAFLLSGEMKDKRYVYDPTFLALLGDCTGQAVIDLGCGSGHSTRLIKTRAHAGRVVGVDISDRQIELAKQIEEKEPLGITYAVADVSAAPCSQFGAFDVATAVFLLHYASTKEELKAMCRHIASAVRPGGRFVGLLPNPGIADFQNEKYDVRVELEQDTPADGERRRVTYWKDGRPLCSFFSYYWSHAAYEDAFEKAEFRDVTWHQPIVSSEGLAAFPPGYWDDFLATPPVLGVIAHGS